MVNEGVYMVSFAAEAAAPERAERVEAIAVLRDGRLLGSDPNGGVFTGCYRYDADRGKALVDVELAVPPHGVLVTGLTAGPDGLTLALSGRFDPPRPVSSAVLDVAGEAVAVELRFLGRL